MMNPLRSGVSFANAPTHLSTMYRHMTMAVTVGFELISSGISRVCEKSGTSVYADLEVSAMC